MASHQLTLAVRASVSLEEGAEGIGSHGVVQLGMITANQTRTIDEIVVFRHEGFPPVYNLAVQSAMPPEWAGSLVVSYTGSPIPSFPGPGVLPFLPGPAWISPAPPGALAPLDIFTANASAATHVPGGFLYFSNPGSIHTLRLTGSVPSGVEQGVYHHHIYISGSLTPLGLRTNVARLALALHVQRAE